MLRKLSFVVLSSIGLWLGNGSFADADHCGRGYYSGHRPPVVYHGVPTYSAYRLPSYGAYPGRSMYSGGYPTNWSYFGPSYGSGINAPFGGYGMGGFPRSGSYGGGGGFPSHFGQ